MNLLLHYTSSDWGFSLRGTLKAPPHKPQYDELLFKREPTPPKPHKNVTFEGWDTETNDGKAFVVANSTEWKKVNGFEEILSFISNRAARGKRNVWWNMDYDVTAILKHKPEILRQVTEDGQWISQDGETSIFYIPNKFLKIRPGNKNVVYHYDASQFYRQPLSKAAKNFLGKETHKLKHERENLIEHDIRDVGEYCRRDAQDAKELAELYASKLNNIDLYPKHFISQGNLAEQLIRTHADVPTWRDNPKYANIASWKTLRGAWIDLWQRGCVNVWKYDIKSAYPAAMIQLPDFRQGRWVRGYEPESLVGFHLCDVTADNLPPLLATYHETSLLYPEINKIRCWLTNPEIKRIQNHGHVRVIDGTSFVPNPDAGTPWRDLLLSLQDMKDEAESDPAYYLAVKAMINSFYGKTVQKVEVEDGYETGKIFNPVAGCMTLALCRCWIYDAIHPHWDNVVAIATDSIAMDKPIKNELDIGQTLGQWEVEGENKEGIFVKPGVYQVEGERPHTRGFKPVKNDNGEPVSYWDLFKGHESDEYVIEYKRPISSRQAVHWDDLGQANVFVDWTYTLSVNDSRRIWHEDAETFHELTCDKYDSSPVPFDVVDALGF